MAKLQSTRVYCTPQYSTMAVLHSTLLYINVPWLYVTASYSTMGLLRSTLVYTTQPWLYITLPDSTVLYIALP